MALFNRCARASADPGIKLSDLQTSIEEWMAEKGRDVLKLTSKLAKTSWKHAPQPSALADAAPLLRRLRRPVTVQLLFSLGLDRCVEQLRKHLQWGLQSAIGNLRSIRNLNYCNVAKAPHGCGAQRADPADEVVGGLSRLPHHEGADLRRWLPSGPGSGRRVLQGARGP